MSNCIQNVQIGNVYFQDICDETFAWKTEEFKELQVRNKYFNNAISSDLDTQRVLKIEKIIEKFVIDNSDKIIAHEDKLVQAISMKTKEVESEDVLYALKYLSLLIDSSKEYTMVELEKFNNSWNLDFLDPATYTVENITWGKQYSVNLWNSVGTYVLQLSDELEIHMTDKTPLYLETDVEDEIKFYKNGILKANSDISNLNPWSDLMWARFNFTINVFDSWLVTYGNINHRKWYINDNIYDLFDDILKLDESQSTRWYITQVNENTVTFKETPLYGGSWINENGYENFVIDLDTVEVIWKSFIEPINLDNLDLTSYETKMMNNISILPNNSWYFYYDWEEQQQIINPDIITSRKDIKNIEVKEFWSGYVEVIRIIE